MGQYFLIVNTTKKEYLYPHNFGSGLKFMEFTGDALGPLTGLAHLLGQSSDSSGMGADPDITGRWIGDHVVIVGDYDDSKLYKTADDTYENISDKVINHMAKNQYVRDEMMTKMRWDGTNQTPVVPPTFTQSQLGGIL